MRLRDRVRGWFGARRDDEHRDAIRAADREVRDATAEVDEAIEKLRGRGHLDDDVIDLFAKVTRLTKGFAERNGALIAYRFTQVRRSGTVNRWTNIVVYILFASLVGVYLHERSDEGQKFRTVLQQSREYGAYASCLNSDERNKQLELGLTKAFNPKFAKQTTPQGLADLIAPRRTNQGNVFTVTLPAHIPRAWIVACREYAAKDTQLEPKTFAPGAPKTSLPPAKQ